MSVDNAADVVCGSESVQPGCPWCQRPSTGVGNDNLCADCSMNHESFESAAHARIAELTGALLELLPLAEALADRDAGDGYEDEEDQEFGAECEAALARATAVIGGAGNA